MRFPMKGTHCQFPVRESTEEGPGGSTQDEIPRRVPLERFPVMSP